MNGSNYYETHFVATCTEAYVSCFLVSQKPTHQPLPDCQIRYSSQGTLSWLPNSVYSYQEHMKGAYIQNLSKNKVNCTDIMCQLLYKDLTVLTEDHNGCYTALGPVQCAMHSVTSTRPNVNLSATMFHFYQFQGTFTCFSVYFNITDRFLRHSILHILGW